MKNAPFNITLVLLAAYFAAMICGGVFALILKAMGFTGFWGIFLAAFLTVPIGSVVRQSVARSAAEQAGAKGETPFAFSLVARLAIGAIVAAGIAYMFSLSTFYSFGFLVGAVAALMTALVISLIFYLKTAFSS
ncbi:MAG: hypothetical protein ABJF50_12070 [Paracoccaceae bacterium]|uniref:hypothetical protein n=1 Tax=Roseibium sp. TaxID=1936156 RepID=UPI003264B6D2